MPSDERPLTDAAIVDAALPVAEGAPEFCHRAGSDRVREVFCAPVIDSLASLQRALQLGPAAVSQAEQNSYVQGAYAAILMAHSTALGLGLRVRQNGRPPWAA